jgi:hypothetical protein
MGQADSPPTKRQSKNRISVHIHAVKNNIEGCLIDSLAFRKSSHLSARNIGLADADTKVNKH